MVQIKKEQKQWPCWYQNDNDKYPSEIQNCSNNDNGNDENIIL